MITSGNKFTLVLFQALIGANCETSKNATVTEFLSGDTFVLQLRRVQRRLQLVYTLKSFSSV